MHHSPKMVLILGPAARRAMDIPALRLHWGGDALAVARDTTVYDKAAA